MKKKIALFCNVSEDAVITAKDVKTIYEVPLYLNSEGSTRSSQAARPALPQAQPRAVGGAGQKILHPKDEVTIGIVGKYVAYEDSYKSSTRRSATAGWRTTSRCASSGSKPRRSPTAG